MTTRVLLTGMSGTGKSTVVGELRTLRLQETVEPQLRAGASLEVDTSAPLDEVVAAILDHVQP